jgi:hypothetical protein
MRMRNHNDASRIYGPSFERRVYELLMADDTYFRVRFATLAENREEHFDVYAESESEILRVECKSLKDNQDGLTVVEGRTNCTEDGETFAGWLYGKANLLAHERADEKVMWVPMSSLRDYVASQGIDWNAIPYTKKAAGRLYTRTENADRYPMIEERVICAGMEILMETRGDRIVYFPTVDIEKLQGVIIK